MEELKAKIMKLMTLCPIGAVVCGVSVRGYVITPGDVYLDVGERSRIGYDRALVEMEEKDAG